MNKKKLAIVALALVLCIGIVSAALLPYFGLIQVTTTVNQAVLVDGKGYVDMPITESPTVAGGESFCRYHWLQSQTSVPVNLVFDTDITYDGGIIVTYSTACLQQKGSGVAQWSTEQVHKRTYSAKLTTVTTDDIARAYIPVGDKTLAEIGSVSFWTYVDYADNQNVRPWVGIYLTSDPTCTTLEKWFELYFAGSSYVFYIQAEPCYTDGYSGDFDVWQFWNSEGTHPLKWLGLESPDLPYGAPTLHDYVTGAATTGHFASREYGTLAVVGIKFAAGYGGTWASFCGYVDDVTINNKAHDLELFPEDTPFILQPREILPFYICYEFATNIKAGTYDIYSTVKLP